MDRQWTLLLTGETAGLVGEKGFKFSGSPDCYERVDVVEADHIAQLELQLAALREAAVPLLCFAQVIATSGDASEGSKIAANAVLNLDVVVALDKKLTALAQEGD